MLKDKLKTIFSRDKTKTEIKKLKKLKKEYEALDAKLIKGSINKKELDRYYKVKEEVNKMAKKFVLRDGKLVLNTEQGDNTMVNEHKNESVAQQRTQQAQPQQAPAQQPQYQQTDDTQQRAYAQEDAAAQARAQQEEQMRVHQEQQLRAQQEAQARAQYEARLKAQQEAQARAQQEAQMRAYQESQAVRAQQEQLRAQQQTQQHQQVPPQQHQQSSAVKVVIAVQDLPELTLGIAVEDLKKFESQIDNAMVNGNKFVFGPYHLNGNKILMYRFDE